MTAETLRDVSRETRDRLTHLAESIRRWNPAINLVSRHTLADLWDRHIVDSAQILRHLRTEDRHWADLGSGGGLPGLVVAIMARDSAPDLAVTLVESDQRKAAFLRKMIADLGLSTDVIARRIEEIDPLQATTISARALAPLDRLITLAERHLLPGGQMVFPKGRNHAAELQAALANWAFESETYTSETNPESVVLIIKEPRRV